MWWLLSLRFNRIIPIRRIGAATFLLTFNYGWDNLGWHETQAYPGAATKHVAYRLVLLNAPTSRTAESGQETAEGELYSIYDCALASPISTTDKKASAFEVARVVRQAAKAGELDLPEAFSHSALSALD